MNKFGLSLRFLFKPLTDRFKLGEGGLALFNITHAWYATHDYFATLVCAVMSLLVLCAIYGYNDYIDRQRDLQNPKKEQAFVRQINSHASLFISLNGLLSVVLLIAAFFFIGKMQAVALLALLVINASYSNKLKAIPRADILVVAMWGGTFTLITPVMNYQLALLAGVMTGIAHLFQMLTDETTDRQTNVSTTIVKYPRSKYVVLCGLTVALMFTLHFISSINYCSLSAVLPLVFYLIIKQVSVSWFFSRVYFAAVWLLLLTTIYGGI